MDIYIYIYIYIMDIYIYIYIFLHMNTLLHDGRQDGDVGPKYSRFVACCCFQGHPQPDP